MRRAIEEDATRYGPALTNERALGQADGLRDAADDLEQLLKPASLPHGGPDEL